MLTASLGDTLPFLSMCNNPTRPFTCYCRTKHALGGEVDGKFVFLRMPVCGMYICVCGIGSLPGRAWMILRIRLKKGKWLSRKTRHRLVNAEENTADLKAQGKKPGFTHGLLD